MATPLRRGRIVWIELLDPQGRNPKRRPAVVLTDTPDIRADGVLLVAGVSPALGLAAPGLGVALPYNPTGRVSTKLRKPCEVVCDWLASVPLAAVEPTEGTCRTP